LYAVNPNVVQVQAINRDADYLFASKHNEAVASELSAEFLHNCLKRSQRKNVLLFTGSLKSDLHYNASVAFGAACDALGLRLLANVDMKDSEEYSKTLLPTVFAQYGDLTDGIYITSGASSTLCRYLEENGYDIPFVSFDTHRDIRDYMEKGIISATIAQNISGQTKVAFEMLVKYIITGEPCPKTVYTDVQLVLKSNIHQFN
jgi:ABC-type sugar transport system substrate-binding protein